MLYPMKKYFFYHKTSSTKEPIQHTYAISRMRAAIYFASIKKLDIKSFLNIFSISK